VASSDGSEGVGCATGLVTLIAERPTEVVDLVGGRLLRNGSTELLRVLLRKTGEYLLLLMGTVGNMMMASN
jgi:hypothetical protein